jgi:hypothetical protein
LLPPPDASTPILMVRKLPAGVAHSVLYCSAVDPLARAHAIVGGAGVLLVLDLLGAPWYRLTIGVPGITLYAENHTGLERPAGWLGVLALLLTLALLQTIGLQRLGRRQLPQVAVPWPRLQFGAAVAVFGLVGLKFLSGVTHLAWGAFVGVLLAAALAYGGALIGREDA